MFVEEYDVIGGATAGVSMWRLDDAIMDTNVHTGLNVAPTFEVQEVRHCVKGRTLVADITHRSEGVDKKSPEGQGDW